VTNKQFLHQFNYKPYSRPIGCAPYEVFAGKIVLDVDKNHIENLESTGIWKFNKKRCNKKS